MQIFLYSDVYAKADAYTSEYSWDIKFSAGHAVPNFRGRVQRRHLLSTVSYGSMNSKPDLDRLTRLGFLAEAERGKIAVFEFPNVIPVDKRDCWILERMLEERDGIFAKAIKAFSAIKDFDFHDPHGSEC